MHIAPEDIPAADAEINLAFATLVVDEEIEANVHTHGTMAEQPTIFSYDFNDSAALSAFKDFERLQSGDAAVRVGHPDSVKPSPFVSSSVRSAPKAPQQAAADTLSTPIVPGHYALSPQRGGRTAPSSGQAPAAPVPLNAPTVDAIAPQATAAVHPPTAPAPPPAPAATATPPVAPAALAQVSVPATVQQIPAPQPQHASVNATPDQTWPVQPINAAPALHQHQVDHGAIRPLQYPAHGIAQVQGQLIGAHDAAAQYGPAPINRHFGGVDNPLGYAPDTPRYQPNQGWKPTAPSFQTYVPFHQSANHANGAHFAHEGWTAPHNSEYSQGTWNAAWRPESISESLNTRGYALLPTPEPRPSATSGTTQFSSVASQKSPGVVVPKPKKRASLSNPPFIPAAPRARPPSFFSTPLLPVVEMPQVKPGATKPLSSKGDQFTWTVSNSNSTLRASDVKVTGAVPASLHFHTNDALQESSVFMMQADNTWLDVTVNYYDPEAPRIKHPKYDLVLALRHNNKPNYITAAHFANDGKKAPPTLAVFGLSDDKA